MVKKESKRLNSEENDEEESILEWAVRVRFDNMYIFHDKSSHLYKRVCPSVLMFICPSV